MRAKCPSPGQALEAGLDCLSVTFPFAANGRAMTLETTDGFVRVVARSDSLQQAASRALGQALHV